MILFCVYAVILLGLGVLDARHGGTVEAFFVNNRASGAGQVGVSIVASCVGGSATMGMAGLAFSVGSPAFWWLGSGACGLVLLTVFLARRIRETQAYTLPQMVTVFLGPGARPLVSMVIVIAWIAILAAQFTAMGKLTASLTGLDPDMGMVWGAALIVLYSLLGGQASVIRSDMGQFVVLLAGLVVTLTFVWVHNPAPLQAMPLEWINEGFPLSRLSAFMVVLGGSYVVCPMLFGRFLSAKDGHSAVWGGALAVVGLVLTAVIIVLLGVACRGLVPVDTPPDDVLTAVLASLPPQVGWVLLLALLSAVLSSADSCLITASTVCSHDLLLPLLPLPKQTSACFRERLFHPVTLCRVVTLALGGAGFAMASQGRGILTLLLMANDVYVCGVVAPVFIGMLAHGGGTAKSSVHPAIAPMWAMAAVVIGGSLGLVSAMTGATLFSYAGISTSAGLCLLGRRAALNSFPATDVCHPRG